MEQIVVKKQPNNHEEYEKPISWPSEETFKQEIEDDYFDKPEPVNISDILKSANSDDDIFKSEVEVEEVVVNSDDGILKSEIEVEDTVLFKPVYSEVPKSFQDVNKDVNEIKMDEIYECHICPIKFYKKELLDKHVQVHVTKMNKKVKLELTDCIYECSGCQVKFSTKELHVAHEEQCFKDNPTLFLKCNECSKKYPTRSALLVHRKRHHKNVKRYKCEDCSEVFMRKYLFKEHKQLHDTRYEATLQCKSCTFKTNSTISLRKHIQEHREKCPYCEYTEPHKHLHLDQTKT